MFSKFAVRCRTYQKMERGKPMNGYQNFIGDLPVVWRTSILVKWVTIRSFSNNHYCNIQDIQGISRIDQKNSVFPLNKKDPSFGWIKYIFKSYHC